jgi:hypothetical protein
MHDASKRLWARPFRTEAASFAVIMAPMMRVSCTSLRLRIVIPWVVPSVHLRF